MLNAAKSTRSSGPNRDDRIAPKSDGRAGHDDQDFNAGGDTEQDFDAEKVGRETG